jgi:hypothetical protein
MLEQENRQPPLLVYLRVYSKAYPGNGLAISRLQRLALIMIAGAELCRLSAS